MRAVDFTTEMAGEIHAGVRKVLQDKGYQYLGSGIDKQAWLEPGTGQVLLIFGYRKNMADFSPDQRMFIEWINYCNKNKNNPHLPRFSGFESFQFQGKNYIQARMEPLQDLPDEVGYLVGHIEEAVQRFGRSIGRGNYDNAFAKLVKWAEHDSLEAGESGPNGIKEAMDLLGGPERTGSLLKTVHKVIAFGIKHGYSVDLHKGNYMARSDGTIVVNDPFVVWLGGSQ